MIIIAQYGLIITLAVFLVFHVLVVAKVIPYTIVWGGRLKSDREMLRFELVSISINCFFLFTILVQANAVAMDFPKSAMTVILWTMTALFALNTVGNVFSKNKLEQRLFTPITLLLSVFSLILALNN